ncbi:MAG: hypothetical protein LBL62_01575 [Planctomycetaceae bacterium]|nr:hypothetical protein [Planctomycetaceae bacterium]
MLYCLWYAALSGRCVVGLTRRVAAGWLVLPFQGGGKTYCPFNENSTEISRKKNIPN